MNRVGAESREGSISPDVDVDEIIVDGFEDPLVPEGKYQAICTSHEIANTSWGYKLIFNFHLTASNVDLRKFYNVQVGERTPKRGKPKWKCGRKSGYIRDFQRLFGKSRTAPPKRFKQQGFIVEVQTVRKDGKGHDLGEPNHYSKIGRIVELA